MKKILAEKGTSLFPLLRCIISMSSVIPIFSCPTACCVHESEGSFVLGCPYISLQILKLVTLGSGELANKSIHKPITLADKLNSAVLWVEYYLY